MKKLLVLPFIILSVHVWSQTKQENALLAVHDRKFQWLIDKQYDSLTSFLDDQLIYIHSNGWTQSKSEVIGDMKSGKLDYQKVDVTESKARIYGNTGIVTAKATFGGALDGKPFELQLSYTEVYVLQKKVWKLVSRHACRLM